MKRIILSVFVVIVLILNVIGVAEATIFTVDADINSISPIYYDAYSTPSYYPSSLNTGLFLNPGDLLEISASGTWSNAPASYNLIFGPNGNPNENIVSGYPGAGYPVAALMGKVGNNDYFFIGSNYSSRVQENGVLYLGFNDTDYGNNWGTIVSQINVTPVPEPATMALFGMGLLGAGVFKRRKK